VSWSEYVSGLEKQETYFCDTNLCNAYETYDSICAGEDVVKYDKSLETTYFAASRGILNYGLVYIVLGGLSVIQLI
jgi:hypothetical protein